MNELPEILVARHEQPALRGRFPENRVVRGCRIGLCRVRDVVAGAAQGFDDLPVNSFVRVQLQAALGSSG